jgi:hypothetical protein
MATVSKLMLGAVIAVASVASPALAQQTFQERSNFCSSQQISQKEQSANWV